MIFIPGVQTILASDNLVTSLPPDLHTAPSLALLQLASNPLDKEEAALLATGLDQVRAVMAARGTKPLQVGLSCILYCEVFDGLLTEPYRRCSD